MIALVVALVLLQAETPSLPCRLDTVEVGRRVFSQLPPSTQDLLVHPSIEFESSCNSLPKDISDLTREPLVSGADDQVRRLFAKIAQMNREARLVDFEAWPRDEASAIPRLAIPKILLPKADREPFVPPSRDCTTLDAFLEPPGFFLRITMHASVKRASYYLLANGICNPVIGPCSFARLDAPPGDVLIRTRICQPHLLLTDETLRPENLALIPKTPCGNGRDKLFLRRGNVTVEIRGPEALVASVARDMDRLISDAQEGKFSPTDKNTFDLITPKSDGGLPLGLP